MKSSHLLKRCIWIVLIQSGLVISLSASAQTHVAAVSRAAPVHGASGFHGGPYGGWHGDGVGWWGVGLGLGLGWEAATLGYPYPWYYYPYPYTYPYNSPTMMVSPSPVPQANWYYCESLKNYYPNVTQCAEPWRVIPTVPPGSSSAP